MINAIKKNGAVLALFALVSTGVVAITHTLTKDTIKEQQQKNLLRVLNEVIPPSTHDNNLFEYCTLVTNKQYLGSDEAMPVYMARKKGYQTGMAIEAIAPDGYNGAIRFIVGFNNWGTITGVRILEHAETPGLGDKIDIKVSDWIESFTGKRLEITNNSGNSDGMSGATSKPAHIDLKSLSMKQWAVRKDGGEFDQFTGATITPRAVVKATKNVSLFYQQYARQITNQPLNCGANSNDN